MGIEQVHGLHATKMLLNTRFSVLKASAKSEMKLRRTLNRSRHLVDSHTRNLQLNDRRRYLEQVKLNGNGPYRYQEDYEPVRSGSVLSVRSTTGMDGSNRIRRASSYTNLVSEEIYNGKQNGGQKSNQFNNVNFQRRRKLINFGGSVQNRLTYYQHGYIPKSNKERIGVLKGSTRGGKKNKKRETKTKEDLDKELDQYMSTSKSALDQQLDQLRKHERIIF